MFVEGQHVVPPLLGRILFEVVLSQLFLHDELAFVLNAEIFEVGTAVGVVVEAVAFAAVGAGAGRVGDVKIDCVKGWVLYCWILL